MLIFPSSICSIINTLYIHIKYAGYIHLSVVQKPLNITLNILCFCFCLKALCVILKQIVQFCILVCQGQTSCHWLCLRFYFLGMSCSVFPRQLQFKSGFSGAEFIHVKDTFCHSVYSLLLRWKTSSFGKRNWFRCWSSMLLGAKLRRTICEL